MKTLLINQFVSPEVQPVIGFLLAIIVGMIIYQLVKKIRSKSFVAMDFIFIAVTAALGFISFALLFNLKLLP